MKLHLLDKMDEQAHAMDQLDKIDEQAHELADVADVDQQVHALDQLIDAYRLCRQDKKAGSLDALEPQAHALDHVSGLFKFLIGCVWVVINNCS